MSVNDFIQERLFFCVQRLLMSSSSFIDKNEWIMHGSNVDSKVENGAANIQLECDFCGQCFRHYVLE